MLSSYDVAKYFLSKDPDRTMFNKILVQKNNRTFYEGNARLNKYLHIAQNLYIAKTGEKLFRENLYAYDNGAVEPKVQENYSVLLNQSGEVTIDKETSNFLDKIFAFLRNATLDELIEISHEDSEWQGKHSNYSKADQIMDSVSHADEYRQQYADALKVMEGMSV